MSLVLSMWGCLVYQVLIKMWDPELNTMLTTQNSRGLIIPRIHIDKEYESLSGIGVLKVGFLGPRRGPYTPHTMVYMRMCVVYAFLTFIKVLNRLFPWASLP